MSEWISVEERLPEVGSVVLIYDEDGTHGVQYTMSVSSYARSCLSGEEHSEHLRGITHWIPLPEPPKE